MPVRPAQISAVVIMLLMTLGSLSTVMADGTPGAAENDPSVLARQMGKLYDLELSVAKSSLSVNPGGIKFSQKQVSMNHALASELLIGDQVTLPGSDGRLLQGKVVRKVADEFGKPGQSTVSISLLNGEGAVELTTSKQGVIDMTLFESRRSILHSVLLSTKAAAILEPESLEDYHCVEYPEVASFLPAATGDTGSDKAVGTDLATLQTLQSRPGSDNVLFIDYWGGTVDGTAWNAAYTSGQPIDYTAYSLDSDTSNFSAREREAMWLGWQEASEDYAPFNINVTTDIAIYAATPSNRRGRMIATRSQDWLGQVAGGVAYRGIWGTNSNYYRTGWVWNLSETALGMTIAHESGHMMGLRHDGNNIRAYDFGHDRWGPIMGAPFGKYYVQWSKGDYPSANNQENDLAIIRNALGEVPDEAGDSIAAALPVPIDGSLIQGVIAPQGLGDDEDFYSFSLAIQTNISITLQPPLGAQGEVIGTNLSMSASLLQNGVEIISAIPIANPTQNSLALVQSLAAGNYVIKVDGQSYDSNWTTGFDEYGNGGRYNLRIQAVDTGIDLTPGTPSLSSASVTTGAPVTVSVSVQNQGSLSSGATTLTYFVSADDNISFSDDIIGTDNVASISAAGSSLQSLSFNASQTAGTYWIGACVAAVAGESNTLNNCSIATQLNVATLSAPDLQVQSFSLTDVSLLQNQSFNASVQLINSGSAASEVSQIRFYRSTNATISTGDTLLEGPFSVPAIAAGQGYDVERTLQAPSDIGTYYIGVCVVAVPDEQQTANNCSSGTRVTVVVPVIPDLAVQALSIGTLEPQEEDEITVGIVVNNIGSDSSTQTVAIVYLSSDEVIDSSDMEAGSAIIDPLPVNQSLAQSITAIASAEAGNYWLSVCLTPVAGEVNVMNNCAAGQPILIRPTTVTPAPNIDSDLPWLPAVLDLLQ